MIFIPSLLLADDRQTDQAAWNQLRHELPSFLFAIRSGPEALRQFPAADAPTGPTATISAKRRLTYLLLKEFDKEHAWSLSPRWLRMQWWTQSWWGSWTQKNLAQFESGTGKPSADSPTTDFLRYATLAFVPANDAEAHHLRCNQKAQSMYLENRIAEIDPAYVSAGPRCVDFDTWADPNKLLAVEIILAAPSAANPGSLFGHTFLRFSYGSGTEAEPITRSRAIAFLAETEKPFREDPLYPIKGIFGVYQAHLVEKPFLVFYHDYAASDDRNLRRWMLRLSPAEKRRLLALIWELKRSGSFRYFFFTDNCASLMVDLLNAALDDQRQITYPRLRAAAPSGTIEGMAFTTSESGKSLLKPLPPLTSLADDALRAEKTRLNLSPLLAPATGKAVELTHQPNEHARLAGYRLLAKTPASISEAESSMLRRYLHQSMLVELHANAESNRNETKIQNEARFQRLRERRRELQAVLENGQIQCEMLRVGLASSTSAYRRQRLHAYRSLANVLANEACPESPVPTGEIHEFLVLSIHQFEDHPAAIAEPALKPWLQSGDSDYSALTERIFVTKVSEPILFLSQQYLQPEHEPTRSPAAASMLGSHSGVNTVTAGFMPANQSNPSRLLWGAAMYDEQLGDQREYGFSGHSAFTFLKTLSQIVILPVPRIIELNSQLATFRTLKPALEEVAGHRSKFGWEAFLAAGRSRPRRIGFSTHTGAGLLIPLYSSAEYANHVVVSGGPVLKGAVESNRRNFMFGPGGYIGFEAREHLAFMGAYQNYVRAKLYGEVFYDAAAKQSRQSYSLSVDAHLMIDQNGTWLWIHHVGSSFVPRLELSTTQYTFATPDIAPKFDAGIGFEFE